MKRLGPVAALLFSATTFLLAAAAPPGTSDPLDLTVHEWGTFTSIAAEDGENLDWVHALTRDDDLPCFVKRAQNVPPKSGLRGNVRMETPVLYFYAPQKAAIDVRVRFRHGLFTEFFPAAAVGPARVTAAARLAGTTGTIAWTDVAVRPGAAEDPTPSNGASHYYAARNTDAAPVQVGEQTEKFLFYRGVGSFRLPMTAVASESGDVTVANASNEPISSVMMFENRKGRLGYQVQRGLSGKATFHVSSLQGDLDALTSELAETLVTEGLYPKEAAAMIETWRDSWFEEGTRVFYIVPRRMVDAVLPLDIRPRPRQLARVFVGRLELMTPARLAEIKTAAHEGDQSTLAGYRRFLAAVRDRLAATNRLTARERNQFDVALTPASAVAPACR